MAGILNRKKQRTTFLGAYLPKNISNYLLLYSCAFKQTKTKIFVDALYTWMKNARVQHSSESLEKKIALGAVNQWKSDKYRSDFKVFLKDLKISLELRKFDTKTISNILNFVRDGKESTED